MQSGVGELGGMHQPPEIGMRLGGATELEEGVDREGAVADPGVAVVPVALPTDLLRERSGCGGRDCARGRIHE